MRRLYLGIVEKDPGSAYGMWFPDMPGCFPATDELADLPQDAMSALRLHVEVLESAGLPVPEPRPFEEVMRDEDVRTALAGGGSALLIPLLADAGRTVRVNISLDKGLVDQIDDAASARGLTRSAFLAQAAREKIAGAA